MASSIYLYIYISANIYLLYIKSRKSNTAKYCDLKTLFCLCSQRTILLLFEFTDQIFDLWEFLQYARILAASRSTLFPSSSFFLFHCVESCFFFVSFEQDFIVRALRLSSVLKNFPVFTKRIVGRNPI